jgi:TetR/AcrR family acrAB operon transcriptional repressor
VTTSDNETRQERILDAAADLFTHYGFDKTTVSDIARTAGISKGAIYLHFDSKDSLLEALVVRELQKYSEKWLALIEADPKGGTIAGLYKNSLYALNDSPIMKAMFTRDGRVLGNYLRKPGNFFQQLRENQTESGRYIFVKMMQDAGAVRHDLDARVIAHIMDMLAYSLVSMDDILPRQAIPPFDDVIEGIGAILDSALTTDEGKNSEIGKTVIRQLVKDGRIQQELKKYEV